MAMNTINIKHMNLLPRWIFIDFFFTSLQLQLHQHYPTRLYSWTYFPISNDIEAPRVHSQMCLHIEFERTPNWNWHVWITIGEYVRNEKQYGTSAFLIFAA